MTVVARYIVVRNGVELDEVFSVKIFLAKNGPAVRQILKGLKGIPGDDSKRP